MKTPYSFWWAALFGGDTCVGKGSGASRCAALVVGTSLSSRNGFGKGALGCEHGSAQELWKLSRSKGRVRGA